MLPTEPPSSSNGFQALLKNKPFLALWIGQLLSQVADKVFFVLLIALLENYQPIAGMKNSMRSTLMIAFTLPAIFFGSAGGIFVDRFSKKQVLVASDVIRGLLTLAIPWLPRQFGVLLVVTFVISTVTQFFAPAEQAAIPLLVKRENLMAANALFTTTMMGALIVGFAVGEPLLSWAKDWGTDYGRELLVGGLYLLSAALMQLIPFKEKPLTSAEGAMVHPWSDFKAGLRYLQKNRLVWNAMLQLTILYSVFAALTVLTIDLAAEIGLKSTQFGFILAASGVGMVFGAGDFRALGRSLSSQTSTLNWVFKYGFCTGCVYLCESTVVRTWTECFIRRRSFIDWRTDANTHSRANTAPDAWQSVWISK
jgi:predicted MFS family arabinose efflux permease